MESRTTIVPEIADRKKERFFDFKGGLLAVCNGSQASYCSYLS